MQDTSMIKASKEMGTGTSVEVYFFYSSALSADNKKIGFINTVSNNNSIKLKLQK